MRYDSRKTYDFVFDYPPIDRIPVGGVLYFVFLWSGLCFSFCYSYPQLLCFLFFWPLYMEYEYGIAVIAEIWIFMFTVFKFYSGSLYRP
jgi:hypothetical protein